jgi:hypothetical protein
VVLDFSAPPLAQEGRLVSAIGVYDIA